MWTYFRQQVEVFINKLDKSISELNSIAGLKEAEFTNETNTFLDEVGRFKQAQFEQQHQQLQTVLEPSSVISEEEKSEETDKASGKKKKKKKKQIAENTSDKNKEEEKEEENVIQHSFSDEKYFEDLKVVLQDKLAALKKRSGSNWLQYVKCLELFQAHLENLYNAFQQTHALDLDCKKARGHALVLARCAEYLETQSSRGLRHSQDGTAQRLMQWLYDPQNAGDKKSLATTTAEKTVVIAQLLEPLITNQEPKNRVLNYADFERDESVLFKNNLAREVKAFQAFRFLLSAIATSIVAENENLVVNNSSLPTVVASSVVSYTDNGRLRVLADKLSQKLSALSTKTEALPKVDSSEQSFFKSKLVELVNGSCDQFIGSNSNFPITTLNDLKNSLTSITEKEEVQVKNAFCQKLETIQATETNFKYKQFLITLKDEVQDFYRLYEENHLLAISPYDGENSGAVQLVSGLISYIIDSEFRSRVTGQKVSDRQLLKKKVDSCKETLTLIRDIYSLLNGTVESDAKAEVIFQQVMDRIVTQLEHEHKPLQRLQTGKFGSIIQQLRQDTNACLLNLENGERQQRRSDKRLSA